MKHTRIFTNFRHDPLAGAKGTTQSIFNAEYRTKEIAPLADYVIRELQSLVYPTVRSEIFSLVNVTCPVSNYSVGYQEAPSEELLKPYTGLAMTFAMTSRPLVKFPKELFTVGGANYITHWGTTRYRTTEYVTICIPQNILNDFEINYSLAKDLLYIYNIIGMVSKSFVLDSSWLMRDGYQHRHANDVAILEAQYNNVNLQRLIKTRPMNTWVHNKELWVRAPNLLHESNFYRDFGLYFAREIFDWVKNSSLSFAAQEYVYGSHLDSFPKYIEKGIRDLKQFIRGSDILSREMEAAVCLMYLLVGDDIPLFDMDSLFGLRQFEQMPVVLGDAEHAARELINQTEYLVDIAEVLR